MQFRYCFGFTLLLFAGCSELKLLSQQDILDLLEDDRRASSSSSSSSGETTRESDPNDLDFYGLTDSPTGTNMGGATGGFSGGAAGPTVGNPIRY